MQKASDSLIIVEDEPIIAMMIAEIAVDLGWKVDGTAHSEGEAFKLLADCSPTLALLDIDLRGVTSLGVAARCRDRGIPVVFTTGFIARDIPRSCGDAPILSKPFSPDDLDQALKRGLSAANAFA